MADLTVIASGTCEECGHNQTTHEGNKGCNAPSKDNPSIPCGCENIGSY
jgi:hypothetical protein